MIVNLVLFSGIYYMKVKHPDNDFMALKLRESFLAVDDDDCDDDVEVDLAENRDAYDPDPRSSLVSNNRHRANSISSETHMESMEKVRSLSFV